MPFYDFKCLACGEQFNVMCSIAEKDSGSIVCPNCSAHELDRIFMGFNVSVKGGGCPAREGGCPSASGNGCPSGGCCGGGCGH